MLPYDSHQATVVLSEADPILARHIERLGPFRLEVNTLQSLFAALMESIVYQQLTGKAAATIYRRVTALLPDPEYPWPEEILALPDEALRGAGLSRAKTAAICDLARKALDGHLPSLEEAHTLDDATLTARLTQVRGIGPWTVEMLLIFRLGRPDVLPVTDYGIRKAFMQVYGLPDLPTVPQLRTYGERWRPFRSVASWYLWRVADDKG
jgi:3-methyladenine DNA glycosylase/8-oxoguanine DNA glycosylase